MKRLGPLQNNLASTWRKSTIFIPLHLNGVAAEVNPDRFMRPFARQNRKREKTTMYFRLELESTELALYEILVSTRVPISRLLKDENANLINYWPIYGSLTFFVTKSKIDFHFDKTIINFWWGICKS